ncbi:AraC family transcriptional regulator [Herminiimonas sp. KBW02]|uniref:AraC family transcriptional regulator n=1 Tax=Herminiimonas sp. KBW02 TaxID=2153363 RepID=UPI000F5B6CEA|nr:AraC family transcriptional regulator [Herminiimonas sp. KBW02]RQO35879.1 AraC family transcriptional regulator [Herminiimonas sp. KBW02]
MKQATHFSVQPGWRILLTDMGLNPDHLLRLAGLPADLFARKEATVSTDQYFSLWQAIEETAGAASLPLLVGQAISVEAFDPPIFASLCSPNLNIAMQRLSAFKKLIGPMSLTVDVGATMTAISVECYGNAGGIPKSLALTELVFLTQLVRVGTRQRIVPLEIVVPETPFNLAPYVDYFGVTPKSGAPVRVSFAHQDGIRPFLTANDAMWEYFEPGLRKRLSALGATASMSERVRAVLLEGLPASEYSIELVAKNLAVSKRTLQRQLSEESTSFTDVLNTTRLQLAQHYLRSPSVSQGEIAYLLGFQEVNSFIRAFKDWTGNTPGAYRDEIQSMR